LDIVATLLPAVKIVQMLQGKGFVEGLSTIGSFIGNNASAIGAVTGAIGSLATTGVNIAKGVNEIKNMEAMNEYMQRMNEMQRMQQMQQMQTRQIQQPMMTQPMIQPQQMIVQQPMESQLNTAEKARRRRELAQQILNESNPSGSGFRIIH
jgi:hypothetical protein